LIRRYNITQIPICWYGRVWGASNLKLVQRGRRYLSTLLMLFFQRILISDDLLAERLASNSRYHSQISELEKRIGGLKKNSPRLTRGDTYRPRFESASLPTSVLLGPLKAVATDPG
jgi:dolichol-phosphate mannosyltransferase